MDEEKDQKKINFKATKKSLKPFIMTILIILAIVFVGIGSQYVIDKKTFNDGAAVASQNYTTKAKLDSQNGIVIEKTNENGETIYQEANSVDGISSIFEEIYGADNYLKDDKESTKEEKLLYLMNAELVTKFPYISSIDGDESKLNGIVKFYRYTEKIENSENVDEIVDDVEANEIFYMGDTWINGLKNYMTKANSLYEYPGDNNFVCSDDLNVLSGDFSKEYLKSKIDSAGSEISSIVIMMGINNRSEQAIAKMKEIIKFLAETYTDKEIYVLKMPHVASEYKSKTTDISVVQLNNEIDQYNSEMLTICAETSNAKLIDTTSNMVTSDFYLDEQYTISNNEEAGINLKDYGYQVWGGNILECITKGKSSVDMSMYQMIYIGEEEFEAMYDQYKSTGNREIFKYFTINEDRDIVIATYSQNSIQITSNDPEVTVDSLNESYEGASYQFSKGEDGSYSSGKFIIHKKSLINYDSLISKYSMPFNLLWAFLVQTGSYDFAKEMADLAYDTEINVGIYDNKTISYNTNIDKYIKKVRYAENTLLYFQEISNNSEHPAFNIENSKYSNVIRACYATIEDGQGRHVSSKAEGLLDISDVEYKSLNYTYVTSMSEDGILTGVGSEEQAKVYTTTTHVTNINVSTPAVGITLVDNWIARWEASYIAKEETKVSNTATKNDTEEYVSNDRYKISESVLYGNNQMGKTLSLHSNTLKQNAINKIMDQTKISVSKLDENDIVDHIYDCTTCQDKVKEMTNIDADVKNHYDVETRLQLQLLAKFIIDDKDYVGDDENSQRRKLIYNHTNDAKLVDQKSSFKSQLDSKITYSQWASAELAELNQSFETYRTTIKYQYEKDTVNTQNRAYKFKKIMTDAKHYNSKMTFIKKPGWFWEYIQSTEDTAELEDILRVMFNIVFETDNFGEYDANEILNMFKAFEPKLRMKSASGRNKNLIKEYIRRWESSSMLQYVNAEVSYSNSLVKYISEDKSIYYVHDDGVGHPTVGFGVDIFNSGYLQEIIEYTGYTKADLASKQKKIGIDAEFIDSIEERILDTAYKYIKDKAKEAKVKLASYQIYALVSRYYNCGPAGAIGTRGKGKNFFEAYNEYFDPETHDMYGEVEGDYNNPLYKNYMNEPVTSDNQFLKGLERRRMSEWTLFQTGYLTTMDKWLSRGDILETGLEVVEEMMTYGTKYSTTDLQHTIQECDKLEKGYNVCCATYVAIVLYRTELLEPEFINSYNFHGAREIGIMLYDAGWEEIDPEDAEPGDICGWPGHTFIYAGGNEVLDEACGCIGWSDDGKIIYPTGTTMSLWNKYKQNSEFYVYRAP